MPLRYIPYDSVRSFVRSFVISRQFQARGKRGWPLKIADETEIIWTERTFRSGTAALTLKLFYRHRWSRSSPDRVWICKWRGGWALGAAATWKLLSEPFRDSRRAANPLRLSLSLSLSFLFWPLPPGASRPREIARRLSAPGISPSVPTLSISVSRFVTRNGAPTTKRMAFSAVSRGILHLGTICHWICPEWDCEIYGIRNFVFLFLENEQPLFEISFVRKATRVLRLFTIISVLCLCIRRIFLNYLLHFCYEYIEYIIIYYEYIE